MWERIILGVGLLAGFIWVRTRARALRDDEQQGRKALYGIFFFLGPLLLVGKWAFQYLPFEHNVNFAIELLAIGLMFAATGFFFLRKKSGA